jgi:hypothetical protein
MSVSNDTRTVFYRTTFSDIIISPFNDTPVGAARLGFHQRTRTGSEGPQSVFADIPVERSLGLDN